MDDDYFYNHGWANCYTKLDLWIYRIMTAILVLIFICSIFLVYLGHVVSKEYDEKYCNGSPECRRMMSQTPVRVYIENGCITNGRIVEERK